MRSTFGVQHSHSAVLHCQPAGGCAGAGAVTAWGAPNYETLVLGRVLYGLAIGFGMHAAPAYISETVRRPPLAKDLDQSALLCSHARAAEGSLPGSCTHAAVPCATCWPQPLTVLGGCAGAEQRAGAADQPEGGAHLRGRPERLQPGLPDCGAGAHSCFATPAAGSEKSVMLNGCQHVVGLGVGAIVGPTWVLLLVLRRWGAGAPSLARRCFQPSPWAPAWCALLFYQTVPIKPSMYENVSEHPASSCLLSTATLLEVSCSASVKAHCHVVVQPSRVSMRPNDARCCSCGSWSRRAGCC